MRNAAGFLMVDLQNICNNNTDMVFRIRCNVKVFFLNLFVWRRYTVLFIHSLYTNTHCIVPNNQMTMNNELEWGQPRTNLWYYPSTYLEELGKAQTPQPVSHNLS
jgi:hypothetical protein